MKKLRTVFAIAALSTLFLTGCPKKQDEAKDTSAPEATETTPVVSDNAPKPPQDKPNVKPDEKPAEKNDTPLAGGDMPPECNEYKALADKLASPTCDKLGTQRDTLKVSFDDSWKAWAALPAADRASTAGACKAAAEGLKAAAGTACGW